jgi:hypothetical protein
MRVPPRDAGLSRRGNGDPRAPGTRAGRAATRPARPTCPPIAGDPHAVCGPLPRLMRLASRRITRPFTAVERERYLR